jgi:VWFA-related protein
MSWVRDILFHMSRTVLLLLSLLPLAALAQEMRTGETITVERVLVDARVTTAAGDPILNLTKQDFIVKIDGKPAVVESVEWIPDSALARELAGLDERLPLEEPSALMDIPAPQGRLLVFFVQTDFGRHPTRVGGQMKFLSYVDQIIDGLDEADRVAVLSFDSHLKFRLDFSNDKDEIREAVRSALLIDNPQWPRIVPLPSLASRLKRDEMRRLTSSEQALLAIGNALLPIRGPKSMILLGWGLGERIGGRIVMPVDYTYAKRALESARVSVFALDISIADYHDLELGLGKAAADTGGFYAKTHIFPQLAVGRLQKTLEGHYELEVRKPGTSEPGVHTIDVQVRRRGAVVMARTTYEDNP